MDKNDSSAMSRRCRPVQQHARPAHAASSRPQSAVQSGIRRTTRTRQAREPGGRPAAPGGPGRRHIIIAPGNRSQGGEGST